MHLNLTDEQKKIIEAPQYYNRIKVFAYAGTGKTTTLRLMAERYPTWRFLYLAFNRAIASEARNTFPKNTDIYTTHAFALKYVRNFFNTQNITEYKPVTLMGILNINDYAIAKLVNDCYKLYNYSNFINIDEKSIARLISSDKETLYFFKVTTEMHKYRPEDLIAEITGYLTRLDSMMTNGQIPISHDFYLKFFQKNIKMFLPIIKRYDVIMLDEAQDTNDVTLDIFENLPGKKVMVGDRYQKIYGFRKAIDGMEKFKADIELRLSTSFRFTDQIADVANSILSKFRYETVPLKAYRKHAGELPVTECFISRTNSQLVKQIKQFMTNGKSFNTVRSPEEIFRLPLSIYYFKKYLTTGLRSYLDRVEEKFITVFGNYEQLMLYADTIEDVELLTAINIVDEFGDELEVLKNYALLNNSIKSDILLTTAHTSKGLEWDKVHVLDDFPDFAQLFAESEIDSIKRFNKMLDEKLPDALKISEEINLFYVATTRARKMLDILSINRGYLEMSPVDFDRKVALLIKAEKVLSNKGIVR